MSKIIPFPALLPRRDLAGAISAPPYDVIDTESARAIASENPYSILRITKPEIELRRNVETYDDEVFETARKNFAHFQSKGWLLRDEPSLYVYRMTSANRTQTGIVCAASVDDFDDGLIKKHEKTRINKEDERTLLAMKLRAHLEPVLYVHRKSEDISNITRKTIMETPIMNISDEEGVRHTLWRVQKPHVLVNAFSKLNALYIADGHHRSAAASRVRKKFQMENSKHDGREAYNFFPVVVFPENEMKIYKYNWDGPKNARPLADFTMSDIMNISDRNEIMPPKSTWFDPKLASGLFIYTF